MDTSKIPVVADFPGTMRSDYDIHVNGEFSHTLKPDDEDGVYSFSTLDEAIDHVRRRLAGKDGVVHVHDPAAGVSRRIDIRHDHSSPV